jgi:predicted nucleic-acid-binding protein
LTNDDETQGITAMKVMNLVDEGKMKLLVLDVTIMEICWLLKSYYKYNRKEISNILIHLCRSEGISTEGDYIVEALELFGDKNIDLADSLLSIKSLDQRIPVVT